MIPMPKQDQSQFLISLKEENKSLREINKMTKEEIQTLRESLKNVFSESFLDQIGANCVMKAITGKKQMLLEDTDNAHDELFTEDEIIIHYNLSSDQMQEIKEFIRFPKYLITQTGEHMYIKREIEAFLCRLYSSYTRCV
jgi:hypothetical protein